MAINSPLYELSLFLYDAAKIGHWPILRESFEGELSVLVEKYRERLTAETGKHITGHSDVMVIVSPRSSYANGT